MKIIIVGCGKVGYTLAQQLAQENEHDITMIDVNSDRLHRVTDGIDAIGVVGDGVSPSTLLEAGIDSADLLIAVTGNDEKNLLSCVIAKKAGHCQTIARIRNPLYNDEIDFLRKEMDIAMVINPERTAASEAARIFQFPSATRVDSFAKGRVELVHFKVPAESPLIGVKLYQMNQQFHTSVLCCTVVRGEEVIIPNGSFEFAEGDVVALVAQRWAAVEFFRAVGLAKDRVKKAILAGGGNISYYLSKLLIQSGIAVTIIEMDKSRCEELSDLLPEATIIYGDATDQALLSEEGIENVDGFAALTGVDEENILMSLYVKDVSKATTVTRVDRSSFNSVINEMNLGSIIFTRIITADYILKFVRSCNTDSESDVETLYKLANGKAEALEFRIKSDSSIIGVPISKLGFKPNTLIGCIYRNRQVIIPSGSDCLQADDSVIVVLSGYRASSIRDVFAK